MKQIHLLSFLITLISCANVIKQHSSSTNDFAIINATFPLKLSDLNLLDTRNLGDENVEIQPKIFQIVSSYYFDDCAGNITGQYFKIKDTYITTTRLKDSFITVYLLILNHIPSGQINSKILFYNSSLKQFIGNPIDFNIHALYEYQNEALIPTNLKKQFKIISPEIELIDYDKDGNNEFKLTRLYHIGTANAIENIVLKITAEKIDTLSFTRTFL